MGPMTTWIMLAALAGAGGATPIDREVPFVVRPYRVDDGDTWRGNAVCYGPHRDGEQPGVVEPSASEIAEDLHLMAPHWSLLRTYGADGYAATLLAQIRASHLPLYVMLGVWIAADDAVANQREIDAAVRLARQYPDLVTSVCVGNETQVSWSFNRVPLDTLVAAVRQVRAAVAQPVTAADDYQYWREPESRHLAAEVDFLTVHAHPLWNGRQLEDALPWLQDQLAAVQTVHPDRDLVIGETGWATSVADHGEQAKLIKGKVGEPQQREFYRSLRAWADSTRQVVFVFEAFDEHWKGGDDPAEVEKHWGLFRADRTAKAALAPAPSR